MAIVLSLTGMSPMPVSLGAKGRSVMRESTTAWSISAHLEASCSDASWRADVGPDAVPCAPWAEADWPGSSRMKNSDAITWLSPSDVDTLKYSLLPSAIHRKYAPVKQSACCSLTIVEVPWLMPACSPSRYCTA